MDDLLGPWDRYYSSRDINWKGSLSPLPDLPHGSKVLDIGCGPGSSVIQAAEYGYKAFGVDISMNAVEKARSRLNRSGIDAEVRQLDARSGMKELGRFDCILLHHVLDGLLYNERKLVVDNCIEILEEDGLISFQDFSITDVRYGTGEEVEKDTFLKKDGIKVHFFSLEEVRGLFRQLEEVKLESTEWEQGRGASKMNRGRINGLFRVRV